METLFIGVVSKLQKKFVDGEDVHPGAYSRKKCGYVSFFIKRAKKVKIFENLSKNVKVSKYFEKRAGSCVRLSHA